MRRSGCLLLVARLAWVDSLPDTEFTKVWEGDLELADGLCTGDEVLGLARGVSLSDDTMINQNAVTAQSSTPHNESLPLKEQLWSGIVTASRIGRHAAWLD